MAGGLADLVAEEEEQALRDGDFQRLYDRSDNWHEQLDVRRGAARNRLDMQHGFVKHIVQNQLDRNSYEQAWQQAFTQADDYQRRHGRAVVMRDGKPWAMPEPWRPLQRSQLDITAHTSLPAAGNDSAMQADGSSWWRDSQWRSGSSPERPAERDWWRRSVVPQASDPVRIMRRGSSSGPADAAESAGLRPLANSLPTTARADKAEASGTSLDEGSPPGFRTLPSLAPAAVAQHSGGLVYDSDSAQASPESPHTGGNGKAAHHAADQQASHAVRQRAEHTLRYGFAVYRPPAALGRPSTLNPDAGQAQGHAASSTPRQRSSDSKVPQRRRASASPARAATRIERAASEPLASPARDTQPSQAGVAAQAGRAAQADSEVGERRSRRRRARGGRGRRKAGVADSAQSVHEGHSDGSAPLACSQAAERAVADAEQRDAELPPGFEHAAHRAPATAAASVQAGDGRGSGHDLPPGFQPPTPSPVRTARAAASRALARGCHASLPAQLDTPPRQPAADSATPAPARAESWALSREFRKLLDAAAQAVPAARSPRSPSDASRPQRHGQTQLKPPAQRLTTAQGEAADDLPPGFALAPRPASLQAAADLPPGFSHLPTTAGGAAGSPSVSSDARQLAGDVTVGLSDGESLEENSQRRARRRGGCRRTSGKASDSPQHIDPSGTKVHSVA